MAVKKKSKAKVKDAAKSPLVVDAMRLFSQEQKVMAQAVQTADGFDNFVSRLGLNNNNALSHGTYEFNLITRNRIKLEAAYRGSWVVGAMVDCVAEDMTRAGIAITTNEDKSADLNDIKNAISRLQIAQSLCSNIRWGRLYGGSIAVLQIKGQKLDTPLNLDSIGKDQFQGLLVLDRWQVNPQMTDLIDAGPEMGLPKYYQIVNNPTQNDPQAPSSTGLVKVHHSRVIRNIGIELPYFQAIVEMMWGESILERAWDRLISFDNATMSSAQLIDRANLRTVQVDKLREIIAAGGEAQSGLLAQFDMMRMLQVNEGLTLLDKEDTFSSTAYSFAGLSDMMLQFAQQISGASKIPLVRLYGQEPAGLGGNNDGAIRLYYDGINAEQESKLRQGWELLLKVLWRSVYGKPAPKDLQFKFVPLWQVTSTDRATIAKSTVDTLVGALDGGLVTRQAAMKDLKQNSSDLGLFGNISDEDINEAEDEPPPPPEEGEAPKPAAGQEKEPAVKTGDSAFMKLKKFFKG